MKSMYVVAALVLLGIVSSRPSEKKLPHENKLIYYYFPVLEGQTEIIFNSTESLQASQLKPNVTTMFVFEGFTSAGITHLHHKIIRAYTGREDYNLIIVDWQAYSGYGRNISTPEQLALVYADVAIVQLPFVGRDMAEFIQWMSENSGVGWDDVQLLGGSLGAHAVGTIGRATQVMYNKTLPWITGIDPSLQFSVLDAPFRLGIGDAEFVEIYHTDRFGMGEANLFSGDLNVYINGGKQQPCNSPLCHPHTYMWNLYGYLGNNDTIRACPCNGAACLNPEREYKCGEDGISIGPHIPHDARGSYHAKTGYLEWD